MRARPRRGAFGLRSQIVGAVLVTTVATLAIAALALLGPLEQSLRNAALKTLEHDLGRHPTATFSKLDLTDLPYAGNGRGSPGYIARASLEQQQKRLATQVGGIV